jgi:hypothetical protein
LADMVSPDGVPGCVLAAGNHRVGWGGGGTVAVTGAARWQEKQSRLPPGKSFRMSVITAVAAGFDEVTIPVPRGQAGQEEAG